MKRFEATMVRSILALSVLWVSAFSTTASAGDTDWLSPENNPGIHEKTIRFEKGALGTTVVGAVIRGDRDVYVLRAKAGQEMTLSIGAIEDNAVFDVLSPGETWLAEERQDAVMTLPETGAYKVVVGGTRGNASYTLNVMIRPGALMQP